MHVPDPSSASVVMPKLVLILKADLQNPLTDKKEQKPKPDLKPSTLLQYTYDVMNLVLEKFSVESSLPPFVGR